MFRLKTLRWIFSPVLFDGSDYKNTLIINFSLLLKLEHQTVLSEIVCGL